MLGYAGVVSASFGELVRRGNIFLCPPKPTERRTLLETEIEVEAKREVRTNCEEVK